MKHFIKIIEAKTKGLEQRVETLEEGRKHKSLRKEIGKKIEKEIEKDTKLITQFEDISLALLPARMGGILELKYAYRGPLIDVLDFYNRALFEVKSIDVDKAIKVCKDFSSLDFVAHYNGIMFDPKQERSWGTLYSTHNPQKGERLAVYAINFRRQHNTDVEGTTAALNEIGKAIGKEIEIPYIDNEKGLGVGKFGRYVGDRKSFVEKIASSPYTMVVDVKNKKGLYANRIIPFNIVKCHSYSNYKGTVELFAIDRDMEESLSKKFTLENAHEFMEEHRKKGRFFGKKEIQLCYLGALGGTKLCITYRGGKPRKTAHEAAEIIKNAGQYEQKIAKQQEKIPLILQRFE